MTLKERIQSKHNAIDKAQKSIDRMNGLIAKNKAPEWYNGTAAEWYADDIKRRQREIEYLKKELAELEARDAEAEVKAGLRNVPVITEFLLQWKARATSWWEAKFDAYYTEKQRVDDLKKSMPNFNAWDVDKESEQYKAIEAARVQFYNDCRVQSIYEKDAKGRRQLVRQIEGKFINVLPYTSGHGKAEAMAKLEKDLTNEMNRKYDSIIIKANAICGQITDGQNLTIGGNGELNGFLIGTAGKAAIETISAGGYNIQCFHFRLLIKPYKGA